MNYEVLTNSVKKTNMRVRKFTGFKVAVMAIAVAGMFAFSNLKSGSIKGTVTPTEGATRAWAESSSDTLKALVINGSYEITNAKPGTYRIIIEAKPPYKNAAKEGVVVNDGQVADAGEIKLEK